MAVDKAEEKVRAAQATNDLELLHGERGINETYRTAVLTTVRNQETELYAQQGVKGPTTTCPCGKTSRVVKMFRCFHCGIFWCTRCAKKHFGKGRGV